ncbi:hypothetical protein BC827DRAFT_1235822 [Russula dissimulans]|nr:hypothetical protein BC827DRAFT_1235822 [Russula dissimulans]
MALRSHIRTIMPHNERGSPNAPCSPSSFSVIPSRRPEGPPQSSDNTPSPTSSQPHSEIHSTALQQKGERCT